MQYPSPDQARSIRWINRTGRLLNKIGLKHGRLEPRALIAAASRQTGLDDFGEPDFRQGLEQLVESLESEAQLSTIGRTAAKAELVDNLCRRLRIIDYRKLHPTMTERPITRPLFVVGLPRTGTTILHELLAQDPAHRTPASWEVAQPVPPVQADEYHTDPRIDVVEHSMAQLEGLAPEFKAIHEVGARLPQECVSIFASNFASDQYGASYFVPSYRQWCRSVDMRPTYHWHYQFLQHFQAHYRRQRWCLKTPVHIAYLNALIAQYPDAAIVQTHRDPMDVMASVSSLACTLHSAFSDHVDPIATAAREVEHFAALLQQGMEQRDAMQTPQRFFDIQFQQIISDPLSAIEMMYNHFGFELTTEARTAMQSYLDNRPREKHGKHRYSLEQFGLSRGRHGQFFREYQQRFIG